MSATPSALIIGKRQSVRRSNSANVLLVADGANVLIGQPLLAGGRVVAEVTGQPSTKTVIQHFRRRKNYRRLKGHRQPYVEVRVKHILKPGESV